MALESDAGRSFSDAEWRSAKAALVQYAKCLLTWQATAARTNRADQTPLRSAEPAKSRCVNEDASANGRTSSESMAIEGTDASPDSGPPHESLTEGNLSIPPNRIMAVERPVR